jgi:hypothetical protein
MRKLALTFAALGFVGFAGIAHADQKTEKVEKTDSGTTISGKHKNTRDRKVTNADGTSTETKVETTSPKNGDDHPANDDGKAEVSSKTEHHTTLTGKHETKTTKTVDNGHGTKTETTTTAVTK